MARKKPHLIRAIQIDAAGEPVAKTVRIDELKIGHTVYHETLPPGLVERAYTAYYRVGRIARPELTAEQWVDGFRCEETPEREVAAWEHIGDTFDALGGRTMTPRQQFRTVTGLLLISIGTVDVESQTGLTARKVARLRQAYEHY